MADATVVFSAEIDDKQALAKLKQMQHEIQILHNSINRMESKRSPLVTKLEQIEYALEQATRDYKEADRLYMSGAQNADQEEGRARAKMMELRGEYEEVLAKVRQYDDQIADANSRLETAETEAGKLAAELSQVQAPAQQTAQATEAIAAEENKAAVETEKTTQEMEKLGSTGNEAAQKISKGFSGAGSGISKFGKRLVGLAKRVFVFSMITMALRNVRKWLLNMINTNSEASAALAQLKGAFLTLAQPLLNVLIPALTKVIQVITKIVSAIASLVATLFGTTIQASAAAAESLYDEQNAIEGVGGAAKKASKQLANFDEINQLTGETAGGGGGGASATRPNFQLDGSMLDKLQNFLDDTGISAALNDLFTALGKLKQGIIDFWNSDAGAAVKTILKDAFITAIKVLADVISTLAAVLSGDLWSALDSLQSLSWDVIFGILKIVASIVDLIFNPEGTFGTSAVDAVSKAEEFCRGLPKISEMANKAKETLSNMFEPFKQKIKVLKLHLMDLWYNIKWWWIRNVQPSLDAIFQPIIEAWDACVQWVRDNLMPSAEEGGAGVGEAFAKGLKAGLYVIPTLINGIISAIETALNMIISKINSLSFDIPNKPLYGVYAGQHVGFNIPSVSIPRITIPALAQGAVIPPNREFLAVLGDQKNGTNIEAPLDTIVAAFRRVMAEQGNGKTIVLELDRRELGRAVADVSKLESQRVGLKMGGAYA